MKMNSTIKNILIALCLGVIGVFIYVVKFTSSEDPTNPVLITVRDREVRLDEVQGRIDYWAENGGLSHSAKKEEFIEHYAARIVAVEKAKALGIDKDPEILSRWENLLVGELRSRELKRVLADIPPVSDEEILAQYEEVKVELTTPRQVKIALLHLKASEKMSPNSRDALKERLIKARALALNLSPDVKGFGDIARKYSEDKVSRFKGGVVGWLKGGENRSRWSDTIHQAALDLSSDNALSDVIQTPGGYYLLKFLDHREERVTPLSDSLKTKITKQLSQIKKEQVTQKVLADWDEEMTPQVHSIHLDKLQFLQTPTENKRDNLTQSTPF